MWRHGARSFSALPSGASVLPLPALSPTMETGTIATWVVKEMESFEEGAVICEIETDKATVDYEAVDAGVLARILVKAGSKDLAVGTPIAVIAEDADVAANLKDMDLSFLSNANGAPQTAAPEPTKSAKAAAAPPPSSPPPPQGRRIVSPAAAQLLLQYGLDASDVVGSHRMPAGKSNVITKMDALNAVKGREPVAAATQHQPLKAPAPSSAAQSASPAPGNPASAQPFEMANSVSARGAAFQDVPLTAMRKVIATRLTEAKQSRPHFYASIDIPIDEILAMRKRVKATLGEAPSINDVIVKAAALALRDVPRVNCRLESDGRVVENPTIDVAVAVAIPQGLITPVVKDTDRKGLMQISADVKELAGRAKANKLKPEEYQGGSFTISNLGMMGIADFTAVISPPQSAILAVGAGQQVFACDGGESDPLGGVVNQLTVQLSSDRRLIDDVTAARFLQCLRAYMSEPSLMTL